MKKLLTRLIAVAAMYSGASCAGTAGINVTDSWLRTIPYEAQTTSAYMTINNHNQQPVALVSAKSRHYGRIDILNVVSSDGAVRTLPQSRVVIQGKSHRKFRPGSYHLMLHNPKHLVSAGEQVDIELQFNNGTSITRNFVAIGPNYAIPIEVLDAIAEQASATDEADSTAMTESGIPAPEERHEPAPKTDEDGF